MKLFEKLIGMSLILLIAMMSPAAHANFELFFKNVSQMSASRALQILSKRQAVEAKNPDSQFDAELMKFLFAKEELKQEDLLLLERTIEGTKVKNLIAVFKDKSFRKFINRLRAQAAHESTVRILSKTESNFKKNLPILERAGEVSHLFWVLNGLGLSRGSLFKFNEALASYREAVALAGVTNDPVTEMWTRISIIEMLGELGRDSDAQNEIKSAESRMEGLLVGRDFKHWLNFHRALAIARAGDIDKALKVTEAIETSLKEEKTDEDHMIPFLLESALLYRHKKDYKRALSNVNLAIEYYIKNRTNRGSGLFFIYAERLRVYAEMKMENEVKADLQNLIVSVKDTEVESIYMPIQAIYAALLAEKFSQTEFDEAVSRAKVFSTYEKHRERLEILRLKSELKIN